MLVEGLDDANDLRRCFPVLEGDVPEHDIESDVLKRFEYHIHDVVNNACPHLFRLVAISQPQLENEQEIENAVRNNAI